MTLFNPDQETRPVADRPSALRASCVPLHFRGGRGWCSSDEWYLLAVLRYVVVRKANPESSIAYLLLIAKKGHLPTGKRPFFILD